jgi:hypothetical protein
MIIGLTGSFGAGKGEKARGAIARPCQIFLELSKRNIDKVYSACKAPASTRHLLMGNVMP